MDIDHWERMRSTDVIRVVTRAQRDHAWLVDVTTERTLDAQSHQLESPGYVAPDAFAGIMPDGESLELIPKAVANWVSGNAWPLVRLHSVPGRRAVVGHDHPDHAGGCLPNGEDGRRACQVMHVVRAGAHTTVA